MISLLPVDTDVSYLASKYVFIQNSVLQSSNEMDETGAHYTE